MKGIREAAMSSDTTEPTLFPQRSTPRPVSRGFDYDDYDFDYGYNPGRSYKSNVEDNYYKPTKNKKTLTISMEIGIAELGNIADDTLPEYDFEKASAKAEEIAYDRIEELLGKNYESKFTLSFNTTEGWMTWEVAVELTPNS